MAVDVAVPADTFLNFMKVVVMGLVALPALAEGDWQYRLTPYAWLPSLNANFDIGRNGVIAVDFTW